MISSDFYRQNSLDAQTIKTRNDYFVSSFTLGIAPFRVKCTEVRKKSTKNGHNITQVFHYEKCWKTS